MIKFIIFHNYISKENFLRENSKSRIYESKLKKFYSTTCINWHSIFTSLGFQLNALTRIRKETELVRNSYELNCLIF